MGLLDQFSNLNPEQTQGLLAAASQMLQGAGDPRRSFGIGPALGVGIESYQASTAQAKRRKLEEEQAAQMAQMRAQQMQMGQYDLSHRQRSDAEETAMQSAYAEAGDDPQKLIEAVSRVNPMKGMALRAQMAKQAPKFDTKPQVGMGPDGKPFTYILAEDGTQRRLDGTLPRDKLELANLGGKEMAYNPFALQPGQTFTRTMTPGESASNGMQRDRLNFDKSQVGRPTFNAEAGGFISAPSAANPQGAITPLPGFQRPEKPLTESQGKASLFASRMTKANDIIGQLGSAGTNNTSMIKGALESVPLVGGALGAVGNFAASESQQSLEQAQRDFINAVLRQESGAAIGASEFDSARKQYFPQRGDSPGVIAQKAANRTTAIQGMALQAGPGAAKLGVGGASSPAAPSGVKFLGFE